MQPVKFADRFGLDGRLFAEWAGLGAFPIGQLLLTVTIVTPRLWQVHWRGWR